MLILIALALLCFAAPPPPWAKEGAQRDTGSQKKALPPPFDKADARKQDTVFIIVSGKDSDTKEYSITDPSDHTNETPPMKIVQNGAIISITLAPKFVGSSGALRHINDNTLIWKGKVPKNLQVEINTSEWPTGKFYGGIFDYKFCVVKE